MVLRKRYLVGRVLLALIALGHAQESLAGKRSSRLLQPRLRGSHGLLEFGARARHVAVICVH